MDVSDRLRSAGVVESRISSPDLQRLVESGREHRSAEWVVEEYVGWIVSAAADSGATVHFNFNTAPCAGLLPSGTSVCDPAGIRASIDALGLFVDDVKPRLCEMVAAVSDHVSFLDALVSWTRLRWLAVTHGDWPCGSPPSGVSWSQVSASRLGRGSAPVFLSVQPLVDGDYSAHRGAITAGLAAVGIDLDEHPHRYLFHGTAHAAAHLIMERGIDRQRCRSKADFGAAFYLGDDLADVLAWAFKLADTGAALVYERQEPLTTEELGGVYTFDGTGDLWKDYVQSFRDPVPALARPSPRNLCT